MWQLYDDFHHLTSLLQPSLYESFFSSCTANRHFPQQHQPAAQALCVPKSCRISKARAQDNSTVAWSTPKVSPAVQRQWSCLWILHPPWDKVSRVDSGVEKDAAAAKPEKSPGQGGISGKCRQGTELGHGGGLLLSAQVTAQSLGTPTRALQKRQQF